MTRTFIPVATATLFLAALCTGAGASARGLPGQVGVDHVAITVPNLVDGIQFFSDHFACDHIFTAGPFSDPKGDWMATNIGVHPRSVVTIAMMRCGPTQNLELFEYEAPDQKTTPPKNSDIGGNHICFYVKDVAAAVAYLKTIPGVTVMGEPATIEGQPNGGITFVYFTTPWGQGMELISYADGMDYERETPKRMFDVRTMWWRR